MKTKTIWVWAVILGAMATVLFYLITFKHPSTPTAVPAPTTEVAKKPEVEKDKGALPISQGKRAVSIPVNEVQGVSGFVQAGDFVDVVVTSPANWTSESAQILIQHSKVLAVGSTLKSDDPKAKEYRTVTLEVTPIDGVSLSLAIQKGANIQLMLRTPQDQATVPAVQKTMEGLMNGGNAK
ncbi:MAG TPA: Flp pilus assembly protein CpaB [Bacillota bacterium]|nr:Flp pilus assembly protein CpaB [Bacillota bacterium]